MTPWRNSLTLATALVLLCACDGNGGVQSAASSLALESVVTVRGRATKGPIAGARIELLNVDARGQAVGAVVATALTDAAGNWAANVPADHAGLLVRSVGGRFVDESDSNIDAPRTIELRDEDVLLSFLPAGELAASITLVSNALVRKSRLEVDADNFMARLSSNRDLYTFALGLDPLATAAADPLAPVGSSAERRYALIAGALAYALNALAIEQGLALADFRTIELLLADLVDCRLDGIGLGGQVVYDAVALAGRTLNDEIVRFRNNHFDDYADLELPMIRGEGCPATPGTTDATAPVFTSQSAPLVLGAQDADGVLAGGLVLEQAIAAFAATDDRDAAPRIDVMLPDRLPLGRSVIPVFATDGWGNVTRTDWQIDVQDLDAPQLFAPPNVSVAATGVRTPVALGQADVTDNVSAGPALQVTNDAPVAGFVVGDTQVTWRAQDEAGLVASATQTVTVIGAQPQVAASVAPLLSAVGSAIDLDLSVYFTDPFDAALTFALDGLPAGSGLSFDPASGRLSGMASAADLAASPLQLAVSATNGQFDAAVSISLSIAPRSPEFALAFSSIELDEDFPGEQSVASVPAAATPAGAVVYSAVIAQPLVDVTIDQFGQLTLSSVPDAFGATTVDVIATNVVNSETFSQRLDVLVQPVNDPPIALLDSDNVTAVAGSELALVLRDRFEDVDDASLGFTVTMQPRSLLLDADGVLRGTPLESEAAVAVYPLTVTATDAAGASASTHILLSIAVPDRDGDGLSDATELALGTDPDDADSDADGVDDATEVAAGSDPTLSATAVIYLSASGANGNDGGSFDSALRDLGGLVDVPAGISAAQPTFVLLAAADTERYGGRLWLMPPCDHIVFAGSISPADGRVALAADGAPRTTLTALQSPSLEIDGCRDVRIVNLTIADNTRHAVHIENSTININNVHLRHNRADVNGGALNMADSDVTLHDVVVSGNDSGGHGGALAATGSSGSLTLRNVALHGNSASGDGGGLYVDGAAISVVVDNALITGNAAGRGAGVFIAAATTAGINNATFINNRSRLPGQGAAVDTTSGAAVTVRDSIIIRNVDGPGAASALAEGIDSDFNSMDRAPVGANDRELAGAATVFGERYLAAATAQAIDLGSTTAVAAGLDRLFSVTGSVYPDEGVLDRGYHDRRGPRAFDLREDTLSGLLRVTANARARFPSYIALDVTPRVNVRVLGAGHRVTLTPLDGRSDLINVVSGVGAWVHATDLGDGRYRVYLDTRPGAATRFSFTVDGVLSARVLHCLSALGGCGVLQPDLERP